MKLLSCKKYTSSIRSTAPLWLHRRAGASSTSLNLITAATATNVDDDSLDDLIQASERARAATSRLAAQHGVALPPVLSTTAPSGIDKKVRAPSAAGTSSPSHLRPSPGRQGSRPTEELDAAPSHHAEPPPEYQTWYQAEDTAFQKYRYVSKSGLRRTQLRAPPPPPSRRLDSIPATRPGTTFSNSSRPDLALPEREPMPPSPYSHSRIARSTPDLSSTPRTTPVSSRSVVFSAANRDNEREVPSASMSRRPLISGPQALQPRQRLRTLSASAQGSRTRRTPRSLPPSPDRVSTRSHAHTRPQSSSSTSSSSQSFTPYFRPGSEAQMHRPLPPRKGILKSSSTAPSVMSMPLGNWDARSRVTFDSRSMVGSSKRARALSVVKKLFKRDRGG